MRVFIGCCLLAGAVLAASVDYQPAGRRWWSHIQFLADDKLEGRNTGSPGHKKAVQYVAGQFEQAGLKPGGSDGYLQPVKFQWRQIDESKSSLSLLHAGKAEALKLGEDANFSVRIVPEKHVEAQAVFVGYGLQIPELHLDELAGLDLRGKIAVYIAGAPQEVPGELAAHYKQMAQFWTALKKAGAIGTIGIQNPKHSDIPWSRSTLARLQPSMTLADPALVDTTGMKVSIVFNAEHADKLLAGSGHTIAELLALDDAHKPLPKFPLQARVRAITEYSAGELESDNVAGILPGNDPKLKDEYVVLSAHVDHLGIGGAIQGDKIYNGAMDNASGVASLIEVARAIAAQQKNRRSILFVAVTGEEKGLLGSKYFANHPTVKQQNIVADLNLDMFLPLVPLRGITVYGIHESTLGDEFQQIAQSLGVKAVPDDEPQRNLFTRSDQYNFIRLGIPALSFKVATEPGSPERKIMKDWLHDRYHAPSDDTSQPVNLETAARFNEILTRMAEKVANTPQRPAWKQTSFFRRFENTHPL
ncbi:MAG TPA: M28 family metallopeptidase [Bryobacteraceae bacterium]|nr:M28 family metallopeptidase [Bryobacteraceae bacterium]